MSGYHLPDELRARAVALYEDGHGYKAIARELGLSRDLVRDWIQAFRTKGRKGYVHRNRGGNEAFKLFRDELTASYAGTLFSDLEIAPQESSKHRERLEKKENKFREAREYYEKGEDSLLKVAEKFGVNYASFREYIRRFHPESRMIHTYNRCRKVFLDDIEHQVELLSRLHEIQEQKLREDFDAQIARVKASGEKAMEMIAKEMEKEAGRKRHSSQDVKQ